MEKGQELMTLFNVSIMILLYALAPSASFAGRYRDEHRSDQMFPSGVSGDFPWDWLVYIGFGIAIWIAMKIEK